MNNVNLGDVGQISVGKSVLFIFSPKPIVDHFKRPLTYDFNHAFIEAVTEKLVDRPTMHSVNSLMNDPTVLNGVKPGYDGFSVKTSAYSDKWTFILIVDHSNSSLKLPSRVVYYGIFDDEPVTNTYAAIPEQFVNKNCNMIITRKVFINSSPSHVPNRPNHTVMNDVDVIQFDNSIWNAADYTVPHTPNVEETFFTMTPSNMAKTIGDGGGESIVVDYDDSLNLRGAASVATSMETPKFNLRSILSDISLSTDNVLADSMMGDFSGANENPFDDDSFLLEAVDTMVGRNAVKDMLISSSDFIKENDVVTLGNIMSMFSPQVLPIETTISSGDVIPQHVSSINNIFSSLVCSCVPAYMNNIGLTAVSFTFNSHADATQVMHIDSMFDDTQDILAVKWKAFFTKMKTDLFPILLSNGGHFEITIFANVSDTVDVVLNFLDFPILPTGTVYQENCLLGGITSPIVGTANHMSKNAAELETLLNNIDIALPGNTQQIEIY